MEKGNGFNKGLSDLLERAEPNIQKLVKEITWGFDNNIINEQEFNAEMAIDKSKIISSISAQIRQYLTNHYARTFTQFYNLQHSIQEGKRLIINIEFGDSFELTEEQKQDILNDVFSIPNFLLHLLANISLKIMERQHLLGISQFLNEDITEKRNQLESEKELITGSQDRLRGPLLKRALELYYNDLEKGMKSKFSTSLQGAIKELMERNKKLGEFFRDNQSRLDAYFTSWRKDMKIGSKSSDPSDLQKQKESIKRAFKILAKIDNLSFYDNITDTSPFFNRLKK